MKLMDKLLALLGALALLGITSTAYAAPYPTIAQDVGVCDPNAPTHCIAPSSSGNIPVAPASLIALQGQQVLALTSNPTSLTVPIGATTIDIFPEGANGMDNQCLRYRDDGSAPIQGAGSGLASQQDLFGYKANLTSIQFILATGASCSVTINYYR